MFVYTLRLEPSFVGHPNLRASPLILFSVTWKSHSFIFILRSFLIYCAFLMSHVAPPFWAHSPPPMFVHVPLTFYQTTCSPATKPHLSYVALLDLEIFGKENSPLLSCGSKFDVEGR